MDREEIKKFVAKQKKNVRNNENNYATSGYPQYLSAVRRYENLVDIGEKALLYYEYKERLAKYEDIRRRYNLD